ncbi:MAG: hypothetical protein JXR46_16845 [Calditrichaceae bacterium]|nr:hypothetical protein [Calditrichaceae bacterium]MBN2710716.1 hypothetical protein [Calditrichaceae bacterium]RQV92745.1 MAG: hypothetical protein EH224_14530 [Calditrichota bacterium]
MKYAGLTDDPATRKAAHGYPQDWKIYKFCRESDARQWVKEMLSMPGYIGKENERGWKFGYTFSIKRESEALHSINQKNLIYAGEKRRNPSL